MKRLSLFLFLALMIFPGLTAQENLDYQKPSKEILELVDVPRAPSVLLDDKQEYMVFLYRDAYKTIEELSRKELRLGGLRIDPVTNIGSRTTFYTNLKVQSLTEENAPVIEVKGLPGSPKLANLSWSPDQQKMAFTHTTSTGVELWVLEIASATARPLTEAGINANMGDVINWFEDSESILVKMISPGKEALIDVAIAVPNGPTISVADGKKAQNRTYQDLLQNKNDEHNFEQLALSELHKVNLDGSSELWLGSAMYSSISFSPNGDYVMITKVEKPFSYLVPYYRFPSTSTVYTRGAEKVETVLEVPLIEDLPIGFMAVRKGRRSLSWRSDLPASLVFAEALDEGDPAIEVEYRDEVKQLDAPFNGPPLTLLKTINRFAGIQWGNAEVAVAMDRWWNTRNTKTYLFNPSDPSSPPVVLYDRNYQDSYSDPGRFVSHRNSYGSRVLSIQKINSSSLEADTPKKDSFLSWIS